MQFQKPILKQEQKLKMTPQLYQAIQMMALPIQELRLKIEQEIEKNPALEVIQDNSLLSLDDISQRSTEEYNIFEETSDSGYIKYQKKNQDSQKSNFIEGTLTRPESLQEHLLWQLRLQKISKEEFKIGELLIRNLDENGFHIVPPPSLIKQADEETIIRIMEMIQVFDPVGVCSKDYKEALLIQIKNDPLSPTQSYELVDKYLEYMEKGKYKEIQKKMGITSKEIKKILSFIKKLDPLPGRNFYTKPPHYVIPDIMVKMELGEFIIVLNDKEIPVLGINPFFSQIKKEKDYKKEKIVKNYVNSKIKDAKWFINSINQRNSTLLKVCKAIVEFQRVFFRRGPKYLIPLTLKDIAEEVGTHEATVSRISTGKYVQTEWGIFELKYFFTNSISGAGSSGSRFSKQGVKEIMKEIILKQESGKKLSDIEIKGLLAQQGIKIARRTVAKYRKELGIMSSFYRYKIEEEL